MKSTTHPFFPDNRRALLAAAVAVLVSAGTALAQTSGAAGSTSSGSSQKNPSSSTSTTSSSDRAADQSSSTSGTGSSYNAGSSTYSSGTGASGSTRATGSASPADTATSTTAASTEAGAPTGRESSSSNKLGWGDKRFVTKAADAGKAELELAKLAAQQASNPEVKSFAQKLVEDHGKVNSELMSMASSKNVKLDDDDDPKDRHYKRLAKKTGAEFDQEFVEHMIDEHEKDVKMFEKAASDAKDSDIRAFASKHVDHLRMHLQTAQSLRQTIMPTGRTDESTTRATGTRSDTSTSTTDASRSSDSTSGSSRNNDSSSTGSSASSTGTTGSSTGASGTDSGSTTRRPDNR